MKGLRSGHGCSAYHQNVLHPVNEEGIQQVLALVTVECETVVLHDATTQSPHFVTAKDGGLMSYHTNFWGEFTIDPPLDATALGELRARLAKAWGKGAALADRSRPAAACHWKPSPDGAALVWNDVQNFRDYDVWLQFLVAQFFAPHGHVLDGEMRFSGEDDADEGVIRITRNRVMVEQIESAF
jgi:hypothetical protein